MATQTVVVAIHQAIRKQIRLSHINGYLVGKPNVAPFGVDEVCSESAKPPKGRSEVSGRAIFWHVCPEHTGYVASPQGAFMERQEGEYPLGAQDDGNGTPVMSEVEPADEPQLQTRSSSRGSARCSA